MSTCWPLIGRSNVVRRIVCRLSNRFLSAVTLNLYRSMTGIRFPTRPDRIGLHGHVLRGEPLRARTCRCGTEARLDDDGLCSRCGYFSKATVDRTWADQARRQGQSGPVSDLDEYRKRIYRRQFGAAA